MGKFLWENSCEENSSEENSSEEVPARGIQHEEPEPRIILRQKFPVGKVQAALHLCTQSPTLRIPVGKFLPLEFRGSKFLTLLSLLHPPCILKDEEGIGCGKGGALGGEKSLGFILELVFPFVPWKFFRV